MNAHTLKAAAGRAQRPRGFTLLEAVVTVAIIGIMLAFSIPQLGSASLLAKDSQAKATASAAVSAVLTQYGRTYTSQPWGPGDPTVASSALCSSEDYLRYNARPPQPQTSPGALASVAEVQFLAAAVPSTAPGTASVGTTFYQLSSCNVVITGEVEVPQPTVGFWQLGVATAAETENGSACWVISRKVNPVGFNQVETYILIEDSSDNVDGVSPFCTGQTAAWLGAGSPPPGRGGSFDKPWVLDVGNNDDLAVLQNARSSSENKPCINCGSAT